MYSARDALFEIDVFEGVQGEKFDNTWLLVGGWLGFIWDRWNNVEGAIGDFSKLIHRY